jgi:hypothetical protein
MKQKSIYQRSNKGPFKDSMLKPPSAFLSPKGIYKDSLAMDRWETMGRQNPKMPGMKLVTRKPGTGMMKGSTMNFYYK